MLLDILRRLKHNRSPESDKNARVENSAGESPGNAITAGAEPGSRPGGFFNDAKNSTFNQPTMIDTQSAHFHQTVFNTIVAGTATLERLLPHTCPGAALDSGARDPPPRCHPGTRRRIQKTLEDWVNDPKRLRKMVWISGSAGTGKSAVAQTFAEACLERARLGAAYFFSRSSNRNHPGTVIPTLAYQLAVHLPDYGNILTRLIAHDPTILEKAPRAQLKRLIIEPFVALQVQGHNVTQGPLVIVLDGLDECRGVHAQCEFVEMIGEAVRMKTGLPLLWLICSRPEPHLKYMFSRADFSIDCDRERLLIDAGTRDDVERYLRDGFNEIQTRFLGIEDPSWPSEEQFRRVIEITSGLFVLASTILRYVGDSSQGNPMGGLVDFLAFMNNARLVGAKNPLETLDLLYSQILTDIPEDVLPKTRRILYFCARLVSGDTHQTAQGLCNFLDMDQHEFYTALRQLHSVIDVPLPEKAAEISLQLFHASFRDYLQASVRSGKFFISKQEVDLEYCEQCLSWSKVVLDAHCSDDEFDWASPATRHLAALKPKWGSPEAARRLLGFSNGNCWSAYWRMNYDGIQSLLVQVETLDFRYIDLDCFHYGFLSFVNWLSGLGSRTSLLRTEANNALDEVLLQKAIMAVSGTEDVKMMPAVLPISTEANLGYEYFFLSHGQRTCLFWVARISDGWDLKQRGRCRLSCKTLHSGSYTIDDCVVHKYPKD